MEEQLRILVIEDEPGVRRVLCRILADLELVMQDFGSADEALAHLRDQANLRPDIILTDTRLEGGMFGPQFLQTVRAEALAPDAYCVIMSGADKEDAENARQVGVAHAFMPKPWGYELEKVLADAVAHRAACKASVDSTPE